MLGLTEPILQPPLLRFRTATGEVKLHTLVVRLDRRNFMKQIAKTFALETFERIKLYFDQIGETQVNRDARIIFPGNSGRHRVLLLELLPTEMEKPSCHTA